MSDYKGPMPGETVEALRARVAELERENARLRAAKEIKAERDRLSVEMAEAEGRVAAMREALEKIADAPGIGGPARHYRELWARVKVARGTLNSTDAGKGWHSPADWAGLQGELAEARGGIGRLDHVMKAEARLMERLAGTMDTD